jgi:hypothetical protein
LLVNSNAETTAQVITLNITDTERHNNGMFLSAVEKQQLPAVAHIFSP